MSQLSDTNLNKGELMKYKLFKGTNTFDIVDEGNNKAELIKVCKKLSYPATIINTKTFDVIYENKAQKEINQST